MTSAGATNPPRPGARARWLRGHLHFTIALLLLAGTATAVLTRGWIPKRPVPWPEGVEVSPGFRLVEGFPRKIGPYQVPPRQDDVIFEETLLSELGMGKTLDKQRLPRRRSNWYLGRVYVDTAAPPGRVGPVWNLSVTYYTGDRDPVPHVPEICGRAGGRAILSSARVPVELAPDLLPPEWRDRWQEFEVHRTHYRAHDKNGRTYEGVDYYLFSVNGAPAASRDTVRLKLALPTVSYCYFAKIQFSTAPLRGATLQEADEQAVRFLRRMLPAALQTLPSAAAVERAAADDA